MIYENFKILKENFSYDKNSDFYSDFLKENTWFNWFIWNWLYQVTNNGEIITDNNNTMNTWSIWSIIIYILDIIAIWYWMIYSLNILKITVCKIHKKAYEKYWEDFSFPTILKDFNWLDIEKILENINTKSEKNWILSMKKTYYSNINFSKCGECKLNDKNTKIEIHFNHYWLSKNKPINWVKIKSFLISVEDYMSIIEKLEEKNLSNII
jgi:hypothetical protein